MKINPLVPGLPALFATVIWSGQVIAATIDKQDNSDDLNLASSWSGGVVPGAGDVARWVGLAGANSALLGGNISVQGITIGTTGGAVAIGGSDTLTLGSSGIDMSGADQDLTISSNLALARGGQTWNVASGRILSLQTGSFSRAAGSALNFQGSGTVSASMSGLANINGILGPWATVGSGSSTRYATLSGGNIIGFTGGTSANFGWSSGNDNTWNYDVTGPGGGGNVLGVNRVANTARYTGAAVTQFWGNNNTTTITLNGLMNSGSGTLTFAENGGVNQGQLAIGTNNNHELVLHAANAGININIPIINTGANAGSLVISGPNIVTLSAAGGANTYTGGTTVASGTLTLTAGATPGSSGSTLHIAQGAQVINNGGSVITHTVSGAGSFTSTGTTSVDGNWSGFTGTFTHNSSTASSVFNTASATSANAHYVIASAQGSAQGMIAGGNGDYTLQMGSFSGVANSLFRGGNVATGTTTLEIGNLNSDTTFAGAIANGATKTIALTKVGSGTLTLSGSNTYNGATLVSSGTLLVNGSLGNTAVNVAGGTLGGSGSIAGAVSVGATLAPGTSIESLSTGALTMASGSSYVFEVANNSSSGADLVAVNGTLSLTDVNLSLDAASLAALAAGSWSYGNKLTLISYIDPGSGIASGFNGYADDTSYFFGGNEWLFNYNDTVAGINFLADATADSQNRFVTMTLIPEPGTALLGGLGLLFLLRRRSGARGS